MRYSQTRKRTNNQKFRRTMSRYSRGNRMLGGVDPNEIRFCKSQLKILYQDLKQQNNQKPIWKKKQMLSNCQRENYQHYIEFFENVKFLNNLLAEEKIASKHQQLFRNLLHTFQDQFQKSNIDNDKLMKTYKDVTTDIQHVKEIEYFFHMFSQHDNYTKLSIDNRFLFLCYCMKTIIEERPCRVYITNQMNKDETKNMFELLNRSLKHIKYYKDYESVDLFMMLEETMLGWIIPWYFYEKGVETSYLDNLMGKTLPKKLPQDVMKHVKYYIKSPKQTESHHSLSVESSSTSSDTTDY